MVLTRLLAAFPPVAAVTLTAVLFGLQHLSSFLITSRGAADVLANVASSAAYGFGLAAFQWRYAWLWPLVLVHATADFTTILSVARYPDWVDAGISVAFVGYGAALLWRGRRSRKPRS